MAEFDELRVAVKVLAIEDQDRNLVQCLSNEFGDSWKRCNFWRRLTEASNVDVAV